MTREKALKVANALYKIENCESTIERLESIINDEFQVDDSTIDSILDDMISKLLKYKEGLNKILEDL